MSQVDDAAAQRELNAALERFRGDPRRALGLGAADDAAAARRAFMALCKVYHPAKFARHAPPTVKLCNEVFLAIRRCYELVTGAARQPTGPIATMPDKPARAVTSPPAPSTTQPVHVTPSSIAAMKAPQVTPSHERVTQRLPRHATSPTGIPLQRPPTPPRMATAQGTPMPPQPALQPQPIPPNPFPDNPLFEKGLQLARAQKWADARVTFGELAVQNPGDPRVRAYLHYARGWEAFGGGKQGEARAEWQRALACDPGHGLARWALESTGLAK